MKKNLALMMTIVMSGMALIGCSNNASVSTTTSSGSDATTADSTSGGDGVLTMYCFFEGGPKEACDYYTQQTGNEVDFEEIDLSDMPTKLSTVLGSDDEPDIVYLERSLVGQNIQRDDFIDMGKQWGDQPEMQDYINNTEPATKDPGYYNGELKAIGWECNVGAYYYRSDLAAKYLGINSVDEMETAISTEDDFFGLQDKLDAANSGLKLVGEMDTLSDAVLSQDQTEPFVTDGTFTITKSFQDDLQKLKDISDSGYYYTTGINDVDQQTEGAKDDKFLGTIAPSWFQQRVILNYQQPDVWEVAKCPYSYSSGGTYIGVTQHADKDMAWDFLKMTFMSPQWLADNIDNIGFVGNPEAVDIYESQNNSDGSGNEFFCGEDTTAKFLDIAKGVTAAQPSSAYDQGIMQARSDTVSGYLYQGIYSSVDDACNAYKSEVQSLYPDLNIVIE